MNVLDLRSLGSLAPQKSSQVDPSLEFRCSESSERLREERQAGTPCPVSSEDVWRVAVNGYETAGS